MVTLLSFKTGKVQTSSTNIQLSSTELQRAGNKMLREAIKSSGNQRNVRNTHKDNQNELPKKCRKIQNKQLNAYKRQSNLLSTSYRVLSS